MENPTSKNRLSQEESLYLRQHATNPIHWFAWGSEAFEKAKAEDKLMFISIGYSSCHWCHVMEHEVFEKQEAADYLNRHFVCIKVDREERPDIDQVYMLAVQLMTGRGGWPLNCFALPDGRPLQGGTYFPLAQFLELAKAMVKTYREDKVKMLDFAAKLQQGVTTATLVEQPQAATFKKEKLSDLVAKWSEIFDPNEGGMLTPPKFPLPNNYEFLSQYSRFTKDENLQHYVALSLHKIIRGGIYDQIQGGLMRYSVDLFWKVPHFEKMLYDNAQFLSLLSQELIFSEDQEYRFVLEQTGHWLETTMKTADGFYKSSVDADAGGEEGLYYIWKKEELKALFPEEYDKIRILYQVTLNGFWKKGYYILLREGSFQEVAKKLNMSVGEFEIWFKTVNSKLLHARNKREAPRIDAKVVFSWNCMLAIAFVDMALALSQGEYLEKAVRLAQNLEQKYIHPQGLYRIVDEKNKIKGFLDDYAYYIRLCVELHQATLDQEWLRKAQQTLQWVEQDFGKQASLFYYAKKDDLLMTNTLEHTDNVIPASNSVLAHCYWDLGVITGNETWMENAQKMLATVYGDMARYGSSYSNWALLLQKLLQGDLLVSYEAEIGRNKHLEIKRDMPFNVLFNKEIKARGKEIFQICHFKQCALPEEGFDRILSKVQQILRRNAG